MVSSNPVHVRRCGLVSIVLSGGLAVSSVALAQPLEVRVTAVQAAERGPSDAELTRLRPRLRRLAGYRSFRVMHEETRRCPWRLPQAFDIPGGPLVRVVPKGIRDDLLVLQVTLREGTRTLVDTDLRLQNHGTMMFGVGRDASTADAALIILLRAETEEE